MHFGTSRFDRAGVIVAWNHDDVAGYALNAGGYWWCVDRSHPHRRRQVCHSSGDCIVWLRQTTGAMSYQTLADRDELRTLLGNLEIESEARLVAAKQSSGEMASEFRPIH